MGDIWRNQVELSGISGRVRCEPGWQLDPVWSDRLTDFDLWLVWAGRGVMRVNGRTVALRPGVCLWMRPGGTYIAHQDPRNRLGVSFAHFQVAGATSIPPPFELTEVRSLALAEAMMAEIVRRRERDPDLANRLMGDLLACLSADHREREQVRQSGRTAARRRREDQIHQLVVQIREEPGKKWRVRDLAREAGLAPDHFSRVFREVTGLRPQTLIVRHRLQRAQQLLLETPLQVGEIAHALGFRDVFYFSRQFRDHFGVPPSVYRKTAN